MSKKGEIQAIWASYSSSEKKNPSNPLEFYRGMPVYLLDDILGPMKRGEQPILRSLETEFWPLNLAEARSIKQHYENSISVHQGNDKVVSLMNGNRIFIVLNPYHERSGTS